jgi:hypothetical protein
LEEDSFENKNIVDLVPFYRKWMNEDGTVAAFRYLLTDAFQTDILYVKIYKLSETQLQCCFLSKERNDCLEIVKLGIPKSLKAFENLTAVALRIARKLIRTLMKFGVKVRSDIIHQNLKVDNEFYDSESEDDVCAHCRGTGMIRSLNMHMGPSPRVNAPVGDSFSNNDNTFTPNASLRQRDAYQSDGSDDDSESEDSGDDRTRSSFSLKFEKKPKSQAPHYFNRICDECSSINGKSSFKHISDPEELKLFEDFVSCHQQKHKVKFEDIDSEDEEARKSISDNYRFSFNDLYYNASSQTSGKLTSSFTSLRKFIEFN